MFKVSGLMLFGALCACFFTTTTEAWSANSESDLDFPAPSTLVDSNTSRASLSLSQAANMALLADDFSKAERLAAAAIAKDSENFDAHRIYAESLESRYRKDNSRDLSVMQKCIEEWLIYMRAHNSEAGRIHFDGVGMSNFALEHDNRYILAQRHLQTVVGFTPHAWETNKHFLQRVQKKFGNLAVANTSK
jgi:hypothetical protein